MNKIEKIITEIKQGFLKKTVLELRWIYQFLREFRGKILGYTILTLLSMMISFGFTFLYKMLVDGLTAQEWEKVIFAAACSMGFGMVNMTFIMICQRMAAKVSTEVKKQISLKTYNKILKADWEQVVKHHSGDLMTRMQEDIGTVAGSTVGWIPSVTTQMIRAVLSLGVIVYYDYSMIIVIGLAVPIVLLGAKVFLGKMYVSNNEQRVVTSRLMSLYKETFQHLQSIKAFGLLDYFNEKMEVQQNKRQKADLEVSKYSLVSWAIMYSCGQLVALICLAWAVYHVYQGIISLGTMTLLLILAASIASIFKSLVQLIPTAVGTISSAERIRAILALPEEQMENEELYKKMYSDSTNGIAVEMKHMSFSYDTGREVFGDVSYAINPGEIVAFVGPSGQGKTTMLRILLGLVKAKGECSFKTENYQLPVSPEARMLIAYVPQGNTVLNGTIAENLRMLKPDASDEDIVQALRQACAYEFVEKLPDGIYHNIGESGIGFSEGQNQRLAIARALMCNTPILFLDEATSALDVATERRVLANLMNGHGKRTCILTTHRPSVLSMCDRVYRIAEQTVAEIDETEIEKLMNEF